MADLENVSTVTATAPTSVPLTAEIPITQGSLGKSAVAGGGAAENEATPTGNQTSNDLGTSPSFEKSSNSHPHDSEYDTASDLEGNEEYDDDDLDDSLTEDDDYSDDETETDDEEDDDAVVDINLQGQEKIDSDVQKKVDEDRSNPQYIPKRGTFYEHDDRTAELEGEGVIGESKDAGECPLAITGSTGNLTGSKTSTTPTISTASKTMKKWQPASAVDRWSHDRFDPSEQAPKSRAELVNAYGYDIRTEDAPPKARRRRRYGRGPSKYSRNWEDESAYLKTNNKERKPPKSSDFPALNEKSSKTRRIRRTREEKENRLEKRKRDIKTGEGRTEITDKIGPSSRNNHVDDTRVEFRTERFERIDENSSKQKKLQKPYKNRVHGQNQTSVGRQTAMEFKQKSRTNYQNSTSAGPSNFNSSSLSSRLEAQRQPQQQQQQQHIQQTPNIAGKAPNGSGNVKDHNKSVGILNQLQSQMYEGLTKNKHLDQGYQTIQGVQCHSPLQQQQAQQQHSQMSPVLTHTINRQNSQIQTKAAQQPTSNLSQRLQQVQNRNDPSHVGSVQMHALATQNQQQIIQQQQQQQSANIIMAGTQQQQQNQNISQPMEQRGPPKRYSSLRRSQHDAQHIAEHQQQQLQQIHMQQQQQHSQPPQAMMIPSDQAMIQANLMQMYHQENLQAQLQALQVTQQTSVAKPPNYVAQGTQVSPQTPYPGATPTQTAYYVATPEAYTAATAAVTSQASQAAVTYAAQQSNPNYLAKQQTAAAASLVYNNPNSAAKQTVTATTPYGPSGQVGVVTQPQTGSSTSGGYQNYNTVGGTTYFVPPPSQSSSRPVSLPQRRPTNAIPILPPSEKNKQQKSQQDLKIDDTKPLNQQAHSNQPPIGSAENIDHIIDNMFVQRPAFQPPPTTTTITSNTTNTSSKSSTSSADTANVVLDSSNIANASSQNNTTLTTENTNKSNNETSTAAASSITNATISTIPESANNNQISVQE